MLYEVITVGEFGQAILFGVDLTLPVFAFEHFLERIALRLLLRLP